MLKVGILGCGRIARTMSKTLRMMMERDKSAVLYAVAARDLDRAKAFAAEEGAVAAYGSYEELLNDPEVELVYIATPHSHHAEQMKMCIEAGKPVLCEKAFTANAQQAREVFALAEEKHVLVTEAIWTRYMPSRRMIEKFIRDGVIGEPKIVTANLCYAIEDKPRLVDPALAGGALLDVGIYPLNFASMIFGNDFVKATSVVTKMETGCDRSEVIVLDWGDGRLASLIGSSCCRGNRKGMISGTAGCITVDNINNPLQFVIYPGGNNNPDVRIVTVPPQLTGYEYGVESCIRALEKCDIECPEMPHSETIRMLEIMDSLRAECDVKYPFE